MEYNDLQKYHNNKNDFDHGMYRFFCSGRFKFECFH